jgi:hypothetical protein
MIEAEVTRVVLPSLERGMAWARQAMSVVPAQPCRWSRNSHALSPRKTSAVAGEHAIATGFCGVNPS